MRLLRWIVLLTLAMSNRLAFSRDVATPAPSTPEGGLLYFVDTTSDVVVAGACANGNPNCSLRGAILVANSHPGADGIEINLPAGSVIELTGPLPDISDGVTTTGAGADKLTVRRNTAADFGIFNVTTTGTVTFSGLTISNGSAALGAGIQNVNNGTVNVTDCTLSDNRGNSAGGIFNNNGTVNVTNSTFTGNNATDGGIFGGGGGGAIYNIAGTVNVTNCTFRGNIAAFGGAIYNNGTGTVNVSNSTLTGNHSVITGGGVENDRSTTGTLMVKSSIIALNSANSEGPDVLGSFSSQGFNLIGKTDASTGFTQPTDQTGTVAAPLDPRLDPNALQNNGGPTQTIKLLATSPAIDKGTSAGLTGNLITDQRGTGFARTFDNPGTANAAGGDGTDIGAFEVQTAPPAVLANISTRLRVETGDNIPIAGFIITGTQSKKVIVRALGPSLNVMGVPLAGRVADTTLELRGSGGLIASNDNWRSTQQAEIIASTVPPPNDLESAIVATLPASAGGIAYTAVVRGAGNATGVGQVEVYDLANAVDSQLANISTRGLVLTGDDVMIGGIILLGPSSRRVIVRALGPSINVGGVPVAGRLGDTTLEIRDANGALEGMNDNWRSTQEAAIIATTVPPPNDLESAIVITLPASPGGTVHTAIVRGKNGATGIGQVEVFALSN